jgi:hypothetical protein
VNADAEENAETAAMLRCEECGKLGEDSMKGWRALVGTDVDDEDAPTEAYLLCPACADREFGRLEGFTSGRSSRARRRRAGAETEVLAALAVASP